MADVPTANVPMADGPTADGPMADDVPPLEPYDTDMVPIPLPLYNLGSICYLNALLQALLSCSAFVKAALLHSDYMRMTRTGTAMLRLIQSYLLRDAQKTPSCSRKILEALQDDLRERRPKISFGAGQQSASEALVLLLDMIEPPRTAEDPAIPAYITRLFYVRQRVRTMCLTCKDQGAPLNDTGVILSAFHIGGKPSTGKKTFESKIRNVCTKVTDFHCDACNLREALEQLEGFPEAEQMAARAMLQKVYRSEDHTEEMTTLMDLTGLNAAEVQRVCDVKVKGDAVKVESLVMVSEILPITFNIYGVYSDRERVTVESPAIIRFPGSKGEDGTPRTALVYRKVSAVEHSGALGGGHYVADCVRQVPPAGDNDVTTADGRLVALKKSGKYAVYRLNDSQNPYVSNLSPKLGSCTYIVFYHYFGEEPISDEA